MIHRLRALVCDDLDAVHDLIVENIQSDLPLLDELSSHIFQSGGKHLRPLLLLLSSLACGYQGKEHITLAAMIEFFHTATLLHDDVVDESTLRRGRKTANTIWGSKASILVGDYLLTRYMQLMMRVGNFNIMQHLTNMTHDIGYGEIKQLTNRHNPTLSKAEYFDIIQAKTSLLFATSARIAALLNDVDSATEDAMYAYGTHLGNAFQLIDDALDYCSDSAILGKNIGDDLADGKVTMPVLYALEHATPTKQEQIRHAVIQGSLDNLPDILKTLEETNAIAYTKDLAHQETQKAISALQILPESVYREALVELAHYATTRDH